MALGKGIPVINGFDLNSKLPLDSRAVSDTMEEMNKLVTDGSVGDGQLCYCKADKKLYVLKDNVWSEVGGCGIPVVEGTESATTTDGAFVTYTIPDAQTSCFIFKCDLGIAFVSYNADFGTYNGYLDAEGDVTDGSLKLNDLIVLSGSGTTIDIFFGNIGGSGGGGGSGEGITPKPITSVEDYASLTDTDYLISVNITGNSNVKDGTYILSGNKANGYSYWYPEDKSEGLNMQTYWHYIHYDSTGLTAIIFNSFLDVTDNNKVGFSFNSEFPNNHIFGGFTVKQVPLFSKYTLVTNTSDEVTPILPCTTSDNGKVLSVVNGEAQWASAGGSGSGGTKFDIVQFSDDGVSYTGTITGSNPIILKTDWDFIVPQKYTYVEGLINSCEVIDNNKVTTYLFNNGKYTTKISFRFYIHFITLTNSTDSIYIQYPTSDPDYKEPLDMTHLKRVLSGKKALCSGVLGNSDETRARPLYVAGNAQLTVYYVLNSNTDGTISEKSIENYTISDVVTPLN